MSMKSRQDQISALQPTQSLMWKTSLTKQNLSRDTTQPFDWLSFTTWCECVIHISFGNVLSTVKRCSVAFWFWIIDSKQIVSHSIPLDWFFHLIFVWNYFEIKRFSDHKSSSNFVNSKPNRTNWIEVNVLEAVVRQRPSQYFHPNQKSYGENFNLSLKSNHSECSITLDVPCISKKKNSHTAVIRGTLNQAHNLNPPNSNLTQSILEIVNDFSFTIPADSFEEEMAAHDFQIMEEMLTIVASQVTISLSRISQQFRKRSNNFFCER